MGKRDRLPSKSQSRSPKRPLMGAGGTAMLADGIEGFTSEVTDGRTRNNGDATYQAEVYLTLPSMADGRPRKMCVRGPCRPDKDAAQQDCDDMENAAKEGVKAVRDLAANMK